MEIAITLRAVKENHDAYLDWVVNRKVESKELSNRILSSFDCRPFFRRKDLGNAEYECPRKLPNPGVCSAVPTCLDSKYI